MPDGLNFNLNMGGEAERLPEEPETENAPRPEIENVIIVGSGPS